MNIKSDDVHADRASNFVRAIITLASATNEKEIRFYIGRAVIDHVYTVKCKSNTVMMMDRLCSGIDSLPDIFTAEGEPLHLHHAVKNCRNVVTFIRDIFNNKDKDLSFKMVTEEIKKAFASNTNSARTFELVIAPAVLQAMPKANEISETIFKKWFAELVAYKGKHGNCNVKTSGKDRALGLWVRRLRSTYKKKEARLTEDRIAQLEELGFKWSGTTFEERLAELRAFKDKHDERCPKENDGAEHKQLYQWLTSTRKAYKRINEGKSSKSKLSKLQMKQFAKHGLYKKKDRTKS
jgi:hypothetical protein